MDDNGATRAMKEQYNRHVGDYYLRGGPVKLKRKRTRADRISSTLRAKRWRKAHADAWREYMRDYMREYKRRRRDERQGRAAASGQPSYVAK